MRKLYLLSCAIVLSLGAIAQEFEIIYTASGDIYRGYISEQIPGNTISVYATDATLTLAMHDIQNIYDEYRQVNQLSLAAQQYFKTLEDTATYVKLCSFDYKGNAIDNALTLDQTSDSLRVRMFTTKTYHLPWREIMKVEKITNQHTDYGILDVIQLKDGQEYRGKVVNQVMGKSVIIQTSDLSLQTISVAEISSLAVDISVVEDVFAHIPLLDVLVLKGDSVITGVINSRLLGKHITIYSADTHKECIVELNKIARYRKVENPNYVHQTKIVDTIEHIYINEVLVEPSRVEKENADENSMYVLVKSMSTIKASDSIIVTLHNMDHDSVMIYKLTEEKSLFQKSHKTHPFPYFDIDDEPYLQSVCTKNDEGHLEISLAIKDKGLYVLLLKNNTKGIIINVE